MEEEYLRVGRILGPHATRGEVRVLSLTDYPAERFKKGVRLFALVGNRRRALNIEGVRKGKKGLLVKFKEIRDRTEAEDLDKAYLEIPLSEAKSLPKGTYWYYQIMGLKVYNIRNNQFIGVVAEVIRTGANDVYVIRAGEREILIPAVKEIVKEVNLREEKILIEPLAGLLE